MENIFIPKKVKVKDIEDQAKDVKLFTLDTRDLVFLAGQFLEVSVFGYGEAPISICSYPGVEDIKLCVRKVGELTGALHRVKVGETIGIRGPFETVSLLIV
jgi:NAD(P)H-flavin reductase